MAMTALRHPVSKSDVVSAGKAKGSGIPSSAPWAETDPEDIALLHAELLRRHAESKADPGEDFDDLYERLFQP